jgi:signal peptidase I
VPYKLARLSRSSTTEHSQNDGEHGESVAGIMSRRLLFIFTTSVIVGLAIYVATTKAVQQVTVVSASMEPTLHCANGPGCRSLRPDRIVVSKLLFLFGKIARGDVVVVRMDTRRGGCSGAAIIKRVVGLPGETIAQRSGRVFINRHRLREPYLAARSAAGPDFAERRLPAEHYFVMGDNRPRSCDSRRFGPVLRRDIARKMLFVR